MRFGSVFSGIEAASVAWHPLGWETAFVAEIDRMANHVLRHRLPDVPNLGDIAAPDFAGRAKACGPIDVLVGGSPCQAFSSKGKRGGLSDQRGLLTLKYAELVDVLDPKVVVWENVRGVLDTGKDNAFGHLLASLAGETSGPLVPPGKRWPHFGRVVGPRRSLAWRLLGAEHWGLAQRRNRVVLVGVPLGGPDAAEILLEAEGPQRHSPPDRPHEKSAAERSPGIPRAFTGLGVSGGRLIHMRVPLRPTPDGPVYSVQDGEVPMAGIVGTLTARKNGGGQMNYVYYRDKTGEIMARKLTAREEERLQGFPDDWTFVPKPTPKGNWSEKTGQWTSETGRSKLIGNSMPVPMMRWVGERIERVLRG